MRLGTVLIHLAQLALFSGLVALLLFHTRSLFSPHLPEEVIGTTSSDYDWSHTALSNWSTARTDWRNHRYIFVGGLQSSGTSLMEKLLSSQLYSAGLRVEATRVRDRKSCRRPDPINQFKCRAPQDEGSFVTRAFLLYLNTELPMHNADFSFDCREENPTKSWGNCARAYHISSGNIAHWKKQLMEKFGRKGLAPTTARDGGVGARERYLPRHGNKVLRSPADFRELLLLDWAPFWADAETPPTTPPSTVYTGGPFAPFLVEKDIPNSVRSLLLQELFGPERTSFVFMLRHPFLSCRGFKCSSTLVDQLRGWLLLYETLVQDLPQLQHFVMVHYEGLVIQPAGVLGAVRETLGWSELPLEYQFHGRAVYLPPANHRVYNSSKLYNFKERAAAAVALEQKEKQKDGYTGTGTGTHAEASEAQLSAWGSEKDPGVVLPTRARRLAGYRPPAGSGGVSGKLGRSPLVTIETTDAAIEWSFNYERELRALRYTQPDVYAQLVAMESRLNKFCYSLRTLTPICTHQETHRFTGQMETRLSYVFRQSKHPLPPIDPTVPEHEGKGSVEGAEAIRQRLEDILFGFE